MLGRALVKLRDGLLTLTYPEQCRICQDAIESRDDGIACQRCWLDPEITTLLLKRTICSKCGAPLCTTAQASGGLCGGCAALPFYRARACGLYGGALEASVLFLKSRPFICRRLRALIQDTLTEHYEPLSSSLVIPVPLHKARERQRGFNQAALIASAVSSHLKIELDLRALVRVKQTDPHRAGMDAIDRRESVESAFKVALPRRVKGGNILLVDDVLTTGSTLAAAAKSLLDAGAGRVSVFSLARASSAAPKQLL